LEAAGTRGSLRKLCPNDVSVGNPQGVGNLQAREVFFVIRYNDAIIHFSNGGNDHVERVPWPTGGRPVGHQPRPDEAGLLAEREDSTGEQ
jgi:hypothetical protein